MSTVRASPDALRAVLVAVLGVATTACAYPMMTHSVLPDSGFVFGAGSAFQASQADSPPRGQGQTLLPTMGAFAALSWHGGEPSAGAARITFQASPASGTNFDFYFKIPGRIGGTMVGVGTEALITYPRRGAIPYLMVGWPVGDNGVVSLMQGAGLVRNTGADSLGWNRILLTTISYQPGGRARDRGFENQFFFGFVVGRQSEMCFSVLLGRACSRPLAWVGTSVAIHPRPGEFSMPPRWR